MINGELVAEAVLECTNDDIDWSTVPEAELEMWFQFGIMVCELKDKKTNKEEKHEAGELRAKFLSKIKND